MKTLFVTCLGLLALALTSFAQTPTIAPATPPATPSTSASIAASASPAATVESDLADRIRERIDKRLTRKGVHFTVGSDENKRDRTDGIGFGHDEDIPGLAVPIVAIVFMTVFGAPVLIVAVILYFGFSRNRMMHRTIRMMVEKGQPVPPALLAPPPPAQRQRSDMRRGVVLMMVGLALVVFLGAVNDWEGGTWSIGIIPFLIGFGYLLVWKLEGGRKPGTDNPPPLP